MIYDVYLWIELLVGYKVVEISLTFTSCNINDAYKWMYY